jgi:hypothetical protein
MTNLYSPTVSPMEREAVQIIDAAKCVSRARNVMNCMSPIHSDTRSCRSVAVQADRFDRKQRLETRKSHFRRNG